MDACLSIGRLFKTLRKETTLKGETFAKCLHFAGITFRERAIFLKILQLQNCLTIENFTYAKFRELRKKHLFSRE